MFADESDEVCRLCYDLRRTFTEGVGRITASDQTVRTVHNCICRFNFCSFVFIRILYLVRLENLMYTVQRQGREVK